MSALDTGPQTLAAWMEAFVAALGEQFGNQLLFVGIQGSRARGEAHPGSDIDVVVILEQAGPAELAAYRTLLDSLPQGDLVCGFVSGRGELAAWDRADLFQFYYDTTAYYGSLETLVPPLGRKDAQRAAWVGACGLYHACSHNYLHGRDPQMLGELLKGVGFVSRADWFACEDGLLPQKVSALVSAVSRLLPQLRAAYDAVYLLPNGGQLTFYSLEDGARFAPDILLFLLRRKADGWVQTQVCLDAENAVTAADYLLHLERQPVWAEETCGGLRCRVCGPRPFLPKSDRQT